MKIKRKVPKPSPVKQPLYFVGYSFTGPSIEELTAWYDLEYGGPLKIQADPTVLGGLLAAHGSWSGRMRIPIPPEEAERVRQGLAWEHRDLGSISPSSAMPTNVTDTILFAARLARGLTLLTQGTAFDVAMHSYLNPSDWLDHSLAYFVFRDHITVTQGEGMTDDQEWLHTLGMSKFGLDEVETFQPKGLPSGDLIEVLTEAADEILRAGHSPKVGTQVRLSLIGRTVEVVKHRTASPTGRMVGFRELRI